MTATTADAQNNPSIHKVPMTSSASQKKHRIPAKETAKGLAKDDIKKQQQASTKENMATANMKKDEDAASTVSTVSDAPSGPLDSILDRFDVSAEEIIIEDNGIFYASDMLVNGKRRHDSAVKL